MRQGDVYGYEAYNSLLQNYALSTVLSTNGPPTYIYIFGYVRADIILSVSQTPYVLTDRFVIHLVYPDQGILMEYEMTVEGHGDNYRFCPSNASISGIFMSLGSADDFFNALHGLGDDFWSSYPPDWVNSKTPDNAFGMTIEDFYQIFCSTPNHCLETIKSIWWPEDLWNALRKDP